MDTCQDDKHPPMGFWSGLWTCSLVLCGTLFLETLVILWLQSRFQESCDELLIAGIPWTSGLMAFVFRASGRLRLKHLLGSLIPIEILLAIGLLVFVSRHIDNYWLLDFLKASGLVCGPWLLGMSVGWGFTRLPKYHRMRPYAMLVALLILAAAYAGQALVWKLIAMYTYSHATMSGTAAVKCDAADLKRTTVVATLDAPIMPGTNIIWCATHQIAWNRLLDQAGGSIKAINPAPLVAALNRRDVEQENLDDSTFVAAAGSFGTVLPDIRKALKTKFNGQASPELLPSEKDLPPDGFFMYSYLFNNMPFEWAFDRFPSPMEFAETSVEGFGISQYMPNDQKERMAGTQVIIWDYLNPTNLVIELKTRKPDHHLILARMPASSTLGQTVENVIHRLDHGKPGIIGEADNLSIPVIDFDISRTYQEMTSLVITGGAPKPFTATIEGSQQQVRFRLDEKGALLKSESGLYICIGRRMVFDGPFLVMLRYKDSPKPYFALWIDNAELLAQSPVSGR